MRFAAFLLTAPILLLGGSFAPLAFGQGAYFSIPPAAHQYRADLISAARTVFGLQAPVATLAAQIEQESGWNPRARSAYAAGLTQFTPDTAAWIQRTYGVELGAGGPLSPVWALKAQSRYMAHLARSLGGRSPCDVWVFALWGYNGGPGWVARDRQRAASRGLDPLRYAHVEPFNAGRAHHFWLENRDYHQRIVFERQEKFRTWGPTRCI